MCFLEVEACFFVSHDYDGMPCGEVGINRTGLGDVSMYGSPSDESVLG